MIDRRLAPLSLALLLWSAAACAQTTSSVRYLANEGVAVTHGETTVLFDPLFKDGFGQYRLVSDELRSAIFDGTPPYDGVDAVFVSHLHGDHFDARDMLRLLNRQPGIRLYAPAQAVDAMRAIATADDSVVFERVVSLDLAYEDSPRLIRAGSLIVEATHVPHSGWPERMTDVQNIAFRVTLGDGGTIVHLGDADPRAEHFERHHTHWKQRRADIALPPHWFFGSTDGVRILEQLVGARHSIGIHVPAKFSGPEQIPEALRRFDLFTEPGETRALRDAKTAD